MFASIARRVVAAVALLLASASHARAAETPPVVGVVTDAGGTPLANVQVIIAALNRGLMTGDDGAFAFRALPAGTHHITTMRIGFAPGHADVIVPDSGSTEIRLTIVMRPATIQLSAVQVTATPIGTDPRAVTQATNELSGQALARSLGASVAQTLASEPGVAMRYNGPAANTPVIRGLSGERVLVLQDGERTGDLSSTSADHALSVDPLAAQRIEVVRGPASLLYGNNALGGVVNVISNDIPTVLPTHVDGWIGAQSESGSPGGALSGAVTFPVGEKLALIARAGGRTAGDVHVGGRGTLANSYYRNAYGVGGVGFMGVRANGGVVWRGNRFHYGLPAPPDAAETGVHIEGERQEISGRADLYVHRGALGSIRLNGTTQWYGHDEVEADGAIGTRFSLQTQTLDAMARTELGRASGAVGVSGLTKQYRAVGEEALTPPANSRSAGAFLYQEIPLRLAADADALVPRFQLGARYDFYRVETLAGDAKFGAPRSLDFHAASGSVGISVPVQSAVTVAVSAARAFRAPTVEELYSNAFHAANGTYDRGNPSLREETSQGLDAIVRAQSPRANGQLSAFYNRVNDFITPNVVKDTTLAGETGDVIVPLNEFSQENATLRGVEGRIEGEVVHRLVLGAMGDVVRGTLRSGEPLPFIPAARAGALARWDDGTYTVTAEVRRAFAQRRVPGAATDDDPSATPTDGYTLVNLSAGVNLTVGKLSNSILLRVDNAFDEKYFDATSRLKNFAPNPGRNVALVYKVLF